MGAGCTARTKDDENIKFKSKLSFINTEAEFKEKMRKDNIAVIFISSWSMVCEQISPLFDALSDIYPIFNFYKVDIDDDIDAMEGIDIENVPTFKIYQKSKEIASFYGTNKNDIISFFQRHIDILQT